MSSTTTPSVSPVETSESESLSDTSRPLSAAAQRRQALNKEFYRKAREHIAENISNPEYSLTNLAESLFMSERQLQRIFKANGSEGFRAELTDFRMREASRLIAIDRQSITEISGKVGFRGGMHFAKAFKRCYGYSPREWRAHCRQQKILK